MPTLHPSIEPEPSDCQQAEDAQYYRRVLHGIIEIGANLARLVNEQAEADAAGAAAKGAAAGGAVLASAAPDASVAFERIAGAVRRTIILARHVAAPLPERAASQAVRQRMAARQRIIRSVEDTIEEEVRSPERAESLHAEMLERLDGPDVDDSLIDRPIGEVIYEIKRDLGLHAIVGMRSKRRTPADIAVLCARAAGNSLTAEAAGKSLTAAAAGTSVPSAAARENVPPVPASVARTVAPETWPGHYRLPALADADDAMLRAAYPADP